MKYVDIFVQTVTENRRTLIVLFLLITVGFAAGIPMIEGESSIDQFEADTIENEKLDYIDENFSGDENTTTTQIIIQGDNVLAKDELLDQLEYQETLYDNETINESFTDDELVGVANVIAATAIRQDLAGDLENRSAELNATAAEFEAAFAAIYEDPTTDTEDQFETVRENSTLELTEDHQDTFEEAADELRNAQNETQIEDAYQLGTQGVLADEYEALEEDRQNLSDGIEPTVDEQIEQIESLNESEVDDITETVLSENSSRADRSLLFMPTDYDPGTTKSNATMMIATLEGESGSVAPGNAPASVVDTELAMQELAEEQRDELSYQIFGDGIITEEIDASMQESLLIVAPFAFLFVLFVLAIAYRDPLDITLGLLGIILVLVWTLGFMGWADIAFNQIFIAVPVLLIGLSIDYAIHVFMRHREERSDSDGDLGPRSAMRIALGGVGIALVYVTATTVIGFLSNLASPLTPIQEFGVVSAVGILAAFLVFGALMPALKIELDEWLESRGIPRNKRAFGTGGGQVSHVLSIGKTAARKAPFIVLLVAILLSTGGVYGATQVDTSFQTEDFLADEPPEWTDDLPDALAPTNYTAAGSMDYLNDHFVRQDSEVEILVEDDITDPETLERIADAEDESSDQEVTAELSSGDAALTTPLTVMEYVAADNESFNETFTGADTTGDGIPDENIEEVYDHLYEVDPDQAEPVIYRSDGAYEALRMVVSVDGGAEGSTVKEEMRDVADVIDGDNLTATATGQIIINSQTEDELLDTVVQSLAVSLTAVLLFLMATYRRTEGSATLGAVTILPVAFTVTWILGTMYLLDIPFNIVTGMITSLTIGLGVAYSIHLSERYNQELTRSDSVWEAMETSITGTGGALLGSAATTAGGFAVLIVAFLPFLQQFGLITALMIIYAFLGSVLVLPSLLAIWTRFAGPQWTLDDFGTSPKLATHVTETPGGSGVEHLESTTGDGRDEVFEWAEQTEPASPVTRRIDSRYVHPEQRVHVEVTAYEEPGRFVLREEIDAGTLSIGEVSPEPVELIERDQTLYVVWDIEDHTQLTASYYVTVPSDATTDEEIDFVGNFASRHRTHTVSRDRSVTVIADLFERIIAKGYVTEADLAVARARFENNQLSEEQFERVYQAWLHAPSDQTDISLPPLPR